MKKILLIAGLFLASYHGNSQVLISILLGDKLNSDKLEFGLEGGANWYTMKGLDGAQSSAAFNLGFYFDIKLKNPAWMINTGVIVKSRMGAGDLDVYSLNDKALDSAFQGGHIDRKISYFNVPVMIKRQLSQTIYAKAGIQLGLRSKAKDEFYNEVKDEDDLKYTLDIRDQYHRLDAGLALGLGYRFMKGKGMHIGAQYYYGLVNVSKDDNIPSQFNRSFYLTMGLPIGKGKVKETQADK